MWNDTNSKNRLEHRIANRLFARTWQPSNLPLRPSITAGELGPAGSRNASGSKLNVTLGSSNLSETQEFKALAQSASITFAKTPGQNTVTWMLIRG